MDLPGCIFFSTCTLLVVLLNSPPENNTDSQPGEIDLHGLYVKESIEYTDKAILEAQRRGDSEIHLIVGTDPSRPIVLCVAPFLTTCYRQGHSLDWWTR